jgi:hypothetical protein
LDEKKYFAKPVTESEAPGYFAIIKEPMDLLTMRKKTDATEYRCFHDFEVRE